jgi:hypothetical protein
MGWPGRRPDAACVGWLQRALASHPPSWDSPGSSSSRQPHLKEARAVAVQALLRDDSRAPRMLRQPPRHVQHHAVQQQPRLAQGARRGRGFFTRAHTCTHAHMRAAGPTSWPQAFRWLCATHCSVCHGKAHRQRRAPPGRTPTHAHLAVGVGALHVSKAVDLQRHLPVAQQALAKLDQRPQPQLAASLRATHAGTAVRCRGAQRLSGCCMRQGRHTRATRWPLPAHAPCRAHAQAHHSSNARTHVPPHREQVLQQVHCKAGRRPLQCVRLQEQQHPVKREAADGNSH